METQINLIGDKYYYMDNESIIFDFQIFNNVSMKLKNGYLKVITGINPNQRNFGLFLLRDEISHMLGKKLYFIINTCTDDENTFQAIIYQKIGSKPWSVLSKKIINIGNNTTIVSFKVDKNATNLWFRIDTVKPDKTHVLYTNEWIVTNGAFSINNEDMLYENDLNLILQSELFDIEYYVENYLDEIQNPIIHYLKYGVKNGFNPSSNFDTEWYLKNYGLKDSGINPLVHFIKYGIRMGYLPKMLTIDSLRNNSLKKSLRGKNNYFFLINDSNNEIKQHYDEEYDSNFDSDAYNNFIKSKKNFLSKKNIRYYLFSIPDKSIVCKEFLPFEYNIIKRNINSIENIIDFVDDLTPEHFFKLDSHLNFEGGKLLAFKFLNYIDNQFSLKKYGELIKNRKIKFYSRDYDMFSSLNWSYSTFVKNQLNYEHNEEIFIPINLKNLKDDIPKQFSFCGRRESHYYKNDNSYSNLKVLILHDSCAMYIKDFLSFYFREMFLYWDHGKFDKNVIEWFKPDLVLEIRAERFLEDAPIP